MAGLLTNWAWCHNIYTTGSARTHILTRSSFIKNSPVAHEHPTAVPPLQVTRTPNPPPNSLPASSTTATSPSTTICRFRRRPLSSVTSGPVATVPPPSAAVKHQKTMMWKMTMITRRITGIEEGNSLRIGSWSSNDNNNSSEARNIGEEVYYAQNLHGAEGLSSTSGQKDIMEVENGSWNGRKKESCYASESQESLRTILSDPLTGALMDNALILPCGHSFGSGGMQQIFRMKACYTCSQSVSEDSIAPNLSLRLAVQAFRREQQLQVNRSSKKRKERYDPEDRGTCGDSVLKEHSRGSGVQFPFAVTDRVIIKATREHLSVSLDVRLLLPHSA